MFLKDTRLFRFFSRVVGTEIRLGGGDARFGDGMGVMVCVRAYVRACVTESAQGVSR
jgi:hypothetical protein